MIKIPNQELLVKALKLNRFLAGISFLFFAHLICNPVTWANKDDATNSTSLASIFTSGEFATHDIRKHLADYLGSRDCRNLDQLNRASHANSSAFFNSWL